MGRVVRAVGQIISFGGLKPSSESIMIRDGGWYSRSGQKAGDAGRDGVGVRLSEVGSCESAAAGLIGERPRDGPSRSGFVDCFPVVGFLFHVIVTVKLGGCLTTGLGVYLNAELDVRLRTGFGIGVTTGLPGGVTAGLRGGVTSGIFDCYVASPVFSGAAKGFIVTAGDSAPMREFRRGRGGFRRRQGGFQRRQEGSRRYILRFGQAEALWE